MKIIALLPVRNEAWVLRQALACLSGFCDVVLVSDQQSTDGSREICSEFAKVQVIESPASFIAEQARFRLWDVARQYDGQNLIWCTDADELVSPRAAQRFFASTQQLTPGTVIECLYCHLWDSPDRYRASIPPYAPYWKPIAVLDDRQIDYDRSPALPIHQERVPIGTGAAHVQAPDVAVLHLQWLLADTNQVKQAWYRCRELLHGRAAREINAFYQFTIPPRHVETAPVRPEWIEDVTFPDLAIDRERSWQEGEIRDWFDERGVAFFEPLEIWHVPRLRQEFVRRTRREPTPDRSYRPGLPERAWSFVQRAANRAQRLLIARH
ncbi:MAG TPA: glycosyltransferase [Vicinamibacterales bacterium]|nr:glycosyltransferase [Vicinamibacterales bacterium]